MPIDLNDVRYYLDVLRDAGYTEQWVARELALPRVNPRTIRKWYSGKTTIRTVEYRALVNLTREVTGLPD